jgi:hypothetical protein
MGYRSTVAYTIRFIPKHSPDTDDIEEFDKAKDSFYLFLAEAKSKPETAGAIADSEYLVVDEQKLQFNFFGADLKWYPSYEDVKCHEALIDLSKNWADDGEHEIGGCWACIGDDAGDCTEDSWGVGDYDWLGINRSVYCDWRE